MKKLVFIISIFALFITSCKKNESGLVKYSPLYTDGYVILDREGNENVKKWDVTVTNRIYDEKENYKEECLFSQEFKDENYVKLPDKVFDRSKGYMVLTVKGYNSIGRTVNEYEEVLNNVKMCCDPDEYNDTLTWTCIAFNYAWAIRANRRVLNGAASSTGYLDLDEAIRYRNSSGQGVPCYVYMTQETWNDYTNTRDKWNHFKVFHGLTNMQNKNFVIPMPIDVDNINIIRCQNVTVADRLIGYNGQYVTGDVVYGIRKTKGYWEIGPNTGGHNPITTVTLTGIDPSWSTITAMDRLNSYARECFDLYGYESVACYGQNYDPGQLLPPEGSYSNDFNGRLTKCWQKIDFTRDDILAQLRRCMNGGLIDNVISVLISRLSTVNNNQKSTSGNDGGYIDFSNPIDDNGNIILPCIELQEGLYSFGFMSEKKQYTYMIGEIKNPIKFVFDYTYLVEPLPETKIEGETLCLKLDSYIKTNVLVELIDKSDKVVYESKIDLQPGFNDTKLDIGKIECNRCKLTFYDKTSVTINL